MPGKIGEAWYELGVRDQGLKAGVTNAENRLRSAGQTGEKAFGAPVQKGFDDTGAAGTRLGGVMGKVEGQTSRFGGVFRNLGTGVLQGVGIGAFMGVTVAAGALVGGISSSIDAASNLNETISKTQVVFEGAAPAVLKWGEGSAEAFGMSKNSALGAAATYGNLFTALGLSEGKSADMSTSLVELAGDLASFNNVDPTIALDALRSGLVGEAEPLRQFGVSINEGRIQQEALRLGLIKTTKEALTPAAKAQAIYSIVMQDTSKAQGDFARTSEGLANQQRSNTAKMEDSLARLGGTILPLANMIVPALAGALSDIVDAIAGVVEGIGEWLSEHQVLADALFSIARFVGSVLINGFVALATVVGNVASIIGSVFEGLLTLIKPIVSTIIGVVKNIVDIASQIPGPWQEAASGLRDALATLENDVEAWGEKTKQTAAETGQAVPPAIAGPITDGAPAVAAAATAGITDPMAAAATAGKEKAVAQAKLTPGDMAKALLDQRFEPEQAMEEIANAQETTLKRTKEIAAIEGFLTSKALTKALNDGRPEVRAEAEAWRTEAEDRLIALQRNVPDIARRTGRSYADVLAEQRTYVGQQAAFTVRDAEKVFTSEPGKADKAGEDTGTAFGKGQGRKAGYVTTQAGSLAESGRGQLRKYIGPAVAWGESVGESWARGIAQKKSFLQTMVETFLGPVINFLKGGSPPRFGPLRYIDKWGENIGTTIAGGLLRSRGTFASAVETFLTMPDRTLALVPWLGRNGAPMGTAGGFRPSPVAVGAGVVNAGRTVVVGSIGVSVTLPPSSDSTLERHAIARGIGIALAEELRLTLNRI